MLFVKEPRPGHVKTRLAATLGDDLAAAFYRALVEQVLEATAHPSVARLVFATPASGLDAVRAWLPGEHCLAQEGADLGERMARAYAEAFRQGFRRVVVAGSDVPGLDARRVSEALGALGEADVAIAPAGDGGYSLLALAAPRPTLFEGIAWSTGHVLEQTLAAAVPLRVRVLETLPDLDTIGDLRDAWPALGARLSPALRAAIAPHLA